MDPKSLLARFLDVRRSTAALCQTLTPEDMVVQPMPDASPTKWHLAHTSWFFETFVLAPHLEDHAPFHPRYGSLFNSHYRALGDRHLRSQRGLLTRPPLSEVMAYRRHVEERVQELFDEGAPEVLEKATAPAELAIQHEQQHQERILTDILYTFWMEPLRPVFRERSPGAAFSAPKLSWVGFAEGVRPVGHRGPKFCFDNELPRHRVFLEAFELANRLVTAGEWKAFIDDRGYQRPELWLSDGWEAARTNGWSAPLYWEQRDGEWWAMTLAGMQPLADAEPVCHVSYYEADAYARWAGARLPSEEEWELAAESSPIEGTFLESGRFQPAPAGASAAEDAHGLWQLFGDVWQWTKSPYVAYPGYVPATGALGEYNGKFMVNQLVLRGGSCATPKGHIRASYRNFFDPAARWRFSGLRLAKDARKK